jgi:hypothetical protein
MTKKHKRQQMKIGRSRTPWNSGSAVVARSKWIEAFNFSPIGVSPIDKTRDVQIEAKLEPVLWCDVRPKLTIKIHDLMRPPNDSSSLYTTSFFSSLVLLLRNFILLSAPIPAPALSLTTLYRPLSPRAKNVCAKVRGSR